MMREAQQHGELVDTANKVKVALSVDDALDTTQMSFACQAQVLAAKQAQWTQTRRSTMAGRWNMDRDLLTLRTGSVGEIAEMREDSYYMNFYHYDACTIEFLCVDMDTKKEILKYDCHESRSHHWVQHQGQRFLSLQTDANTIKMFQIDEETKTFTADESLMMCAGMGDEINAIEFDSTFEHIFILKNKMTFEKRAVGSSSDVIFTVQLEEKVHVGATKAVAISEDGSLAAIRGGKDNQYFYLVDLLSNVQHKLQTKALSNGTLAPCFINGSTNFLVIGSFGGQGAEIWDIRSKQHLEALETGPGNVSCTTSTNNILAIITEKGVLQLWDVRSWDRFYSSTFEGMTPMYLHLTADSKFLTIGGENGDRCGVMEIK